MKLAVSLVLFVPFTLGSCGSPRATPRSDAVASPTSPKPAVPDAVPVAPRVVLPEFRPIPSADRDDELRAWADRVVEVAALVRKDRGDDATYDLAVPLTEELLDRTKRAVRVTAPEAYTLNRLAMVVGPVHGEELAKRARMRAEFFAQRGTSPLDDTVEGGLVIEPQVPLADDATEEERREYTSLRALDRAEKEIARGAFDTAANTLATLPSPVAGQPLGEDPIQLRRQSVSAYALIVQGRYAEAKSILVEAFQSSVGLRSDQYDERAAVAERLALAHEHLGEFAAAAAVQERFRADLGRARPAAPADLVARRRHADTLRAANDPGRARAVDEEVLAHAVSDGGVDSEAAIAARAVVAENLRASGDHGRALDLEHQNLDALVRSGAAPRAIRDQRLRVGATAVRAGNWRVAVDALESVLSATRLDAAEREDAECLLAEAQAGSGDRAGARRYYESVLAAREQRLPAGHADLDRVRAGLADLADAFESAGERDEAEAVRARIGDEFRRGAGAARGANGLAAADADADRAVARCRLDEAEVVRRNFLRAARAATPRDEAAVLAGLRELAALLRTTGERDEASHLEREMDALRAQAGPSTSTRTVDAAQKGMNGVHITLAPVLGRTHQGFVCAATVRSASGIRSVDVYQDGILVRPRPPITVSDDGGSGTLNVSLTIRPGRGGTYVRVCAEGHDGESRAEETVFVPWRDEHALQ